MALSETIQYDKIEVVGDYKHIQVRKAHLIKKDGKDIARENERYSLNCGKVDASNNFIDNPLTKEPDGVTDIPAEVKNIANAVWTQSVKDAWKAKLIADRALLS